MISWISVIYLDVVKSRIQADDPTNPRYRSMLDCFQKCYAEGGARLDTEYVSLEQMRNDSNDSFK